MKEIKKCLIPIAVVLSIDKALKFISKIFFRPVRLDDLSNFSSGVSLENLENHSKKDSKR